MSRKEKRIGFSEEELIVMLDIASRELVRALSRNGATPALINVVRKIVKAKMSKEEIEAIERKIEEVRKIEQDAMMGRRPVR